MVFTALTVMGAFSYQRLQTDLFPELDFPSISVVTTYSGVAPEEVETLLTRPIERSVARVEGIDRIESFSAEGRSRVALRFVWGMELDDAMQQVRDAVERARAQLPDDADSPVVYRFNLSNLPVMEIAVESDLDEASLRRFSDDVVSPYLERLAGVASAEVRGARDREIIVELDVERLSALGLSADGVVQAIRDASITVPAGRLEVGSDNLLVRAVGEFSSVDEIAQARITERGGVVIRVADVSTIVDGFEDRASTVRINGVAGVRASVQKSPDANTIEVCDRLMEAIDTFNLDYAGTASLRVIADNSVFIRRSVDGVRGAMVIGAGLALLVLLFFLRDLRSMLVIGISIPISVIGTFL
ncbi:MAG: HAE1 family hydrophobic/amphiphilic exporter-1, partial [Bradymonadia bacterium]